MHSRLLSASSYGYEVQVVEVEVDLGGGLPGLHLVGKADSAAREGRERVRAALGNQGFPLPPGRLAINLAPADFPKQGGTLDLAIALGILAVTRAIPTESLKGWAFLGELRFDGSVRAAGPSLALASALAKDPRVTRLAVPPEVAPELAAIPEVEVFSVESLEAAQELLSQPHPRPIPPVEHAPAPPSQDWQDVRLPKFLSEGLLVAAAGGHDLLLVGPPGCGKTFLSQRFPDLLPDLSPQETLEVARIHSLSGLSARTLASPPRPPLRCPGATISREALLGGGNPIHPGEVTLAHLGVLFLDEACELPRSVLEALRLPLTERVVRVHRARSRAELPADFQLILATNPCPCGYAGHPERVCPCPPSQRQRYLSRISGPLLDRIDLHLQVPPGGLDQSPPADREEIRTKVQVARKRQARRWGESVLNHSASLLQLEALLMAPLRDHPLPQEPRARRKILALSATLSDLEQAAGIEPRHVQKAERLRFRPTWEVAA